MTIRRRVIFISHETIGDRMAGPGIRYAHLSKVLAEHVDLTLAIPSHSPQWSVEPAGFVVHRYVLGDWGSLVGHVNAADVVICPPDSITSFPLLAQTDAALVLDDYDPLLAEWLAAASMSDLEWQPIGWRDRMKTITPHLLCGDFYMVASERQRDWLMGALEVMGRLNPLNYADDPSFRRFVNVVPTGMPNHAPVHTRNVIKGVWPGIAEDDCVVLWGGGLWPWLDVETAIRAVAAVTVDYPKLRLIFPGTKLPNPNMAGVLTQVGPAKELAEALGILDRHVFFGDWLPYDDWPNVLLEADVALSLHKEVWETRLAFRSRTIDYLWAALPVVATAGDATADLVSAFNAGLIVQPSDVDGVAAALRRLVSQPRPLPDGKYDEARRHLSWRAGSQPLIEFCTSPRKAPDRAKPGWLAGPPTYAEPLSEMSTERNRLAALVDGYERGRFIRMMGAVRKFLKWN